MARPSFPKTLREFQAKFGSEEACQQYLASCRWPEGFACLRCVFRHNRRRQPMAAFQTLLGLGTGRTPIPYELIRGAKDIPKLSAEGDPNMWWFAETTG
jgi:Transposase zinc-ribbon domain